MDLKKQRDVPESPSNIIFKKKRGRPRKDQSQNLSRLANFLTMGNQIQGHGGYGQFPPGFARADGNHPHQKNAAQPNYDAMVGQTVNGVIEATFEAGYFLSVRIGNSDTSLRGVVFKPGHYLPVSTHHDLAVAPRVEMVSRNVTRRGRGRGRQNKESRLSSSENVSSSGNEFVTLLGERGSLVPVVLKPANLPNGMAPDIVTPPVDSQPAHLVACKASIVNQTQLKPLEKDLKKDNVPPSAEIQCTAVEFPVTMVEESVSYVVKTITALKDTENESKKPSGVFANEPLQDLNEPPVFVNPLQEMFSDPFKQFPSVPFNFRDSRPGKMTELLLAMQENVMGKQGGDVQHHGISWQ